MNIFSKLILFITSYSPLFLIFAIINFDITKCYYFNYAIVTWAMIGITAISGIMTVLLLKIGLVKYRTRIPVEIIEVENSNHEILAYFFAYALPFMSVPESKRIYVILILMLVTFFVYVKSDLIKYNIFLLCLGYDIYKIKAKMKNETTREIFIIKHHTKSMKLNNNEQGVVNMGGNVYLLI